MFYKCGSGKWIPCESSLYLLWYLRITGENDSKIFEEITKKNLKGSWIGSRVFSLPFLMLVIDLVLRLLLPHVYVPFPLDELHRLA